MNYIRIGTGEYPVSLEMIRSRHPNILLPAVPAAADMAALSYVEVVQTPRPVPAADEHIIEVSPVLDGTVWRQTWDVIENGKTLEQLKAEKIVAINAGYESAIAGITAGYPPSERLTWEIQRGEALAWQADEDADTPWLDTAAAARGIPRLEYIQRTLAKINQFALATAYLTGQRQKLEDQCKAAASANAVAAVQVVYTLPSA